MTTGLAAACRNLYSRGIVRILKHRGLSPAHKSADFHPIIATFSSYFRMMNEDVRHYALPKRFWSRS